MFGEVITRPHVDASEGTITFERIQDVEAILERNKQLQNMPQKWAGEWHHIASIPNVILERWMNEDGVNMLALSGDEFDRIVKRKLRDPDWAWLRTTNRKF